MRCRSELITAVIVIIALVSPSRQDNVQDILSSPTSASCSSTLQQVTSIPHCIGYNGANNLATAQYIHDSFVNSGLTAEIQTFTVWLNLPEMRQLHLISSTGQNYTALLQEDPIPQDPTSNNTNVIPTWLGYSADGDVQGQLIYVNYGRQDDYTYLDSKNISVAGKIVIARYGQVFRGVKVYEAQIRHAIGIIIYSDPMDDGYFQGDPYPDGPFRPPTGVQRGAANFAMFCPGDPSPEHQAYCNTSYPVLPTIPALPISFSDATPFLTSLRGSPSNPTPSVPTSWQGALPFHYHIGPSVDTVQLVIKGNWSTVTGYNVKAEITGSEEPDKIVMFGNHHDAWTFGAVDPGSGTVVLLEAARALGNLTKTGWRPRRTIQFLSWDGEEVGLVGSVAYGEKNAANISANVVAYINADVAVSGAADARLSVSSTPSLSQFVRSSEVTGTVKDPNTNLPLNQVWDNTINPLGFGSDYVVFVDHLGIPCFDASFDGSYGVYHSVYDSYHWMSTVGDPGFRYHVAASQLWSIMVYYLATDTVLPYNYADYHVHLSTAQSALENQYTTRLSFYDMHDALNKFSFSAQVAASRAQSLKTSQNADEIRAFNNMLVDAEKQFLLPSGIPGRPWFKHVVVGPGVHSGYGAVYFPGVQDALDQSNMTLAQQQLNIVTQKILDVANFIKGDVPYPEPPRNWATMIALGSLAGASTVIILCYFIVAKLRSRRPAANQYEPVRENTRLVR